MSHRDQLANSIEDLYAVAAFVHELSEASATAKSPPDEDGWKLADRIGLSVPEVLAGSTIQRARVSKPDPRLPVIEVTLPPEAVARRKGVSFSECWNLCKEGPFGVGKVCVKVCVTCKATVGSVRCVATITIEASL